MPATLQAGALLAIATAGLLALRVTSGLPLVATLALALVLGALALGLSLAESRRRAAVEAGWLAAHAELVRAAESRSAELARASAQLRDESSERRRIADELQDSRARFAGIIESAMDAIITIDDQQRILLFNHAAEVMFQRAQAEVIGQPLEMLLPPRFRDRHQQHVQGFSHKGATSRRMGALGAVSGVRADGSEFPIEASISKVTTGGSLLLTVILRDITDRRRAEAALLEANFSLERRVEQRTAELAAAKDRAESADRLKSAFLATMSHELRTPLNSIIGFTGILQQGLAGPLNAEQAKQVGIVMDSGRHLLALINDILDISKIEADEMEVVRERFSIPEAVRKTIDMVAALATKKGLQLSASVAPDVDTIVSDRRRFEQILLNLLSNAVKFSERGEVALTCRRDGARVVVKVTDNGIGMKPEQLDHLFRPFHQLDTGLARPFEGTGLGLAICQRLLRLLGGEISVRSEWGRGSEFEFWLPLDDDGRAFRVGGAERVGALS